MVDQVMRTDKTGAVKFVPNNIGESDKLKECVLVFLKAEK
jgi:hypothetical protein